MSDHSYAYLAPSTIEHGDDQSQMTLSTSGGAETNPYFFTGFVEHPAQTAQSLLAVAEVARTRYFDPGVAARARDPIVTSSEDVMRFESFSSCNGVYARLDVLGSGLDDEYMTWGTTNVDVNQPLRTALARIGSAEPLHLSVGHDEMAVRSLEGTAIEKRVPLPARWLKGLAEVQIAASAMVPIRELDRATARRTLRDLASRGPSRSATWVAWTNTGARLTTNPDDDAVSLAGPNRLSSLLRLVPYVEGMRVYSPPPAERIGVGQRTATIRVAQPSAWQIALEDALLVLVISPEPYRGFSGEGAIIEALAATNGDAIDLVAAELHDQPHIDVDALETGSGLGRVEVHNALRGLGAAGRVGYDLSSGTYFHRDLPLERDALEGLQPRLLDARGLVAEGAVTIDGDTATVTSGSKSYLVRLDPDGARCTCPWFAKHRGERGPCKHVLAAQLTGARIDIAE